MMSAIMGGTCDMYSFHLIPQTYRVSDAHACGVQDIDEQFLWDPCPITSSACTVVALGSYEGSHEPWDCIIHKLY